MARRFDHSSLGKFVTAWVAYEFVRPSRCVVRKPARRSADATPHFKAIGISGPGDYFLSNLKFAEMGSSVLSRQLPFLPTLNSEFLPRRRVYVAAFA